MLDQKELLQQLVNIKNKAEKMLIDIDDIKNDPFFVIYEFEGEGSRSFYKKEIYDWFYENDLIGKLESFDFILDSVLYLHIVGFRFKDAADATAFKLRWT